MSEPWKTNVFFTSDWHIGHAASIKFDNRPFKDLDHMHKVLINNFNATVSENSITYFLGDLGIGTPQDLSKIVKQLNGTKIMILGNHDKPGIARYITMGFSAVMNGAMFNITNQTVTATHCPLRDVYREDTTDMRGALEVEPWYGNSRLRHRACAFPDFGQFALHGHIHSNKDKTKSKKILGRQFDVGVCGNDYRPVSTSIIEAWIAKTLKEENEKTT